MDEVEGVIGKRQPGEKVPSDEAVVARGRRLALHEIEANDDGIRELSCEVECSLACSGADVEDPFRVGNRSDVVALQRRPQRVVLNI